MTSLVDTTLDAPHLDQRLHALRMLAGFLVRHGRDRPSPPNPPAARADSSEPHSEAGRRAA